MLKKVLNRLDFNYLIELLPEWQREYFKSESLINDKQQLIAYISTAAKEIINNNIQLAFLLVHLDKTEIKEFENFIGPKKSFQSILKLLQSDKNINRQSKQVMDFFGLINNEENKIQESEGYINGPEERFYELLDYQVFVKEQLLTILKTENDVNRALVHMPTGTGKTKMSMHTLVDFFVNDLNKKGLIIWIAHTNTLLEQAEETLSKVWKNLGHGRLQLFRLYDKSNDVINEGDSGVLFIGVQKLIQIMKSKDNLMNALSNNVKLVFFDEAHKSTAVETKKALQILIEYKNDMKKCLIGLTATPGRASNNDSSNTELSDFYNKRIIEINTLVIEQLRVSQFKAHNQALSKMDIISYFQSREILAKLKREELEYDYSGIENKVLSLNKFRGKDDFHPDVVKIFSENIMRNKRIVERIVELVKEGKQIIVFACSVEHGKFLTALLQANKIKASEVYGTTKSIRRISIIEKFKNNDTNVLINCGVLTTGFDSTNINCVFITRPTNSVVLYSQMIGRGLRGPKMGGNTECLLVDMKDNLNKYNDDNEIFKYFSTYWR